jgi:cytidylate kinase
MNENTQATFTKFNQEETHQNEVGRQQLRDALPTKMLVAIDGRAQSGKNTVGALVAEEIDAALVDSGQFYRALTMACLQTGVNLGVQPDVTRFCCSALLEVRFCKESGPVDEAQVAVNGRWFTKEELNLLGVEVCEVSKLELVRARINETLRFCADEGRVVMLGRDIASKVFPATRFAFFLDAPKQVRERRQQSARGWTDATARDQRDAHCISIRRGTTVIDTSKNSLRKSVITILCTLIDEARKPKPGED